MKKLFYSSLLICLFFANQLFATTDNYFGTGGDINGNNWSTTLGGPYNSALSTGGGAIAYFNNATSTIAGNNVSFAGINVNANVSFSTISGTISTFGNGVIPINVGAGFTFDFNGQYTAGDATSGFIKNGDGVLAFEGNSYGGGFTLNAGTIIVRAGHAMGTSGPLVINGGVIAPDAASPLNGTYSAVTIGGNFTVGATFGAPYASADLTLISPTFSLGGATRTITIGGTNNYQFSGVISGDANVGMTINSTANGIVSLNGANTYTGVTTINGGTVRLRNATALGTIDGGTVVNSGGALDLYGNTYTNLEPLSINGTGISFSGALRNSNAAAASFSGTITLAGNSTINTSNGSITLNSTSAISGTGNLTISGGSNVIISSPIAVTGSLYKPNNGTCTLSGANTYSGSTTIYAGTLVLGASGVIPNGSQIILSGGTLSTGTTVGYTETAGTLDLDANSTINLGTGSHTLTFADSHLQNWFTAGPTYYTLTITGWNKTSSGRLFVGTDATGLTAQQLSQITFTGYAPGAKISSSGEIFPSSIIFNGDDLAISNLVTNSTSDMTIQSGGRLTVDASKSVNNLTVEAGGKLIFTGSPVLSVAGNVSYKASKTTSFSVNIGDGSMVITGSVNFYKTMDNTQWYFMSFPCTISVNDIIVDGVTTGAGNATGLGTNWFIKYYAGDQRIVNLGATTNWVSVAHGGTLTANKGYIIGLANAVSGDKVLVFPLTKAIAQSETAPPVPIVAHGLGDGGIAEVHKGWNLVGHPFLSKYTSTSMATVTYVTWYSGGYFTMLLADAFTIDPFTSFFVQAPASVDISFNTLGRQTVSSSIKNSAVDRVKLLLRTATGEDNTSLMLNENYAPDYKIGEDMEKWISTGTPRPQLYSNLNDVKYAFNGLAVTDVQNLPLGIYTNASGAATISADKSTIPNLDQLLLTDTSTGITTDLLTSDYNFTISAGTNNSRFLISANSIPTDLTKLGSLEANLIVRSGVLFISKINVNTNVSVFDAFGHLISSKVSEDKILEIPLPSKGIYIVQMTNGNKTLVRKVERN